LIEEVLDKLLKNFQEFEVTAVKYEKLKSPYQQFSSEPVEKYTQVYIHFKNFFIRTISDSKNYSSC
jgi:hypothetical protein